LRKLPAEIPQDAQSLTGLWKVSREDFCADRRLESMLKLALIAVLLFGLAAAAADLARGRRPLLFA